LTALINPFFYAMIKPSNVTKETVEDIDEESPSQLVSENNSKRTSSPQVFLNTFSFFFFFFFTSFLPSMFILIFILK